MSCSTCRHPLALHVDERCRLTGCDCASPAPTDQAPPVDRRVCIDVPDGYAVTIQLVPYLEAPPE